MKNRNDMIGSKFFWKERAIHLEQELVQRTRERNAAVFCMLFLTLIVIAQLILYM